MSARFSSFIVILERTHFIPRSVHKIQSLLWLELSLRKLLCIDQVRNAGALSGRDRLSVVRRDPHTVAPSRFSPFARLSLVISGSTSLQNACFSFLLGFCAIHLGRVLRAFNSPVKFITP